MQRTCGSLRGLQAFFWLWVFPTSQAESTPAHTLCAYNDETLEPKAKPERTNTARELFKLIDGQKTSWIDQAVNVRDVLVHPVEGLAQVMFRLEIGQKKGNLKLLKIIQPSLAGVQFDQYSHMTLMQIDGFSRSYVDIIKAA